MPCLTCGGSREIPAPDGFAVCPDCVKPELKSRKIIYCDHCKCDTDTCSKLFYADGYKEWKEGDPCPNCGEELYEAASRDDIP